MDDLQRELSALKHGLAQLERAKFHFPMAAAPKIIDVLAIVKASYRRRITALNQRLAQAF